MKKKTEESNVVYVGPEMKYSLTPTYTAKEIEEVGRQIGMTQGIGYCMALFLKYWGEHPWIDEVYGAAGLTMSELREKIDEYDWEILKEHSEYLLRLEDKRGK